MKMGEQVQVKKEKTGEEEEGVHRKRKWGEVEKGRASEIRLTIDELSLAANLEEEEKISTVAFLSVSNLLLQAIDKIGPTMAVLRRDVQRNIERLEDCYVLNPSINSNLVEILKKEVDEGTARKGESCARAMVWLTRSMDFSIALLERLEKDGESSLEQVVEEAYMNTLKPWHGWISSAAYRVALKLLPDRKIFINLIVGEGEDCMSMLKGDIQILISLLQPLLNEIHALLRSATVKHEEQQARGALKAGLHWKATTSRETNVGQKEARRQCPHGFLS